MTTRSPSDIPTAPADRDQQARDLVRALRLIEVTIWLDAAGLNARPMSKLNQEMRDEIEELKPELVELLRTEGTEDVLTLDAEEKQHSDRNTPPRSAAEINADTRLQRAAAAQRREYMNGEINVINHDGLTPARNANSFGHHVQRLVAQRDRRPAGAKCWSPRPGTCAYMWNLFGDDYDLNLRS